MGKKLLLIIAILLPGILLPLGAYAQGVLDLVNVKLSPATPSANEDVTISIVSYTMDLDSSKIIWYVNDEPIKQGVGEKSVQVRTGDFGEKNTVTAVILTPDGRKITKLIALAPSEVDVLWEAQTYTPPFYKGKALPSYKSLVRLTAIPRFNTLSSDPKEFTYDWKYNRTLGAGKGLGKDSVVIPVGYAGTPMPVSVTVTQGGGDWKGVKSLTVTPTEARVALYAQAPLLGTQFNHAIGSTYTAEGNIASVRAVPYFFSTPDYMNGDLLYDWTLGGSAVVSGADPTVLTITKKGSAVESYSVSLKISNPKHVLQRGNTGTVINLPEDQQ